MHPTSPALKRAYADAAGGQVHYYDGGGPGAPVLLLHQSPTSAIDFASVFPLFDAAGLRVIAPDMPGLGMSDAPATPPTIADFAEATLAALDHAGVARVDAVGHHTGAQVAIAAAARDPARFRNLVLYGAPVMSPEALAGFWEMIVPPERAGGVHVPEADGAHFVALFQRLEPIYGALVAQRMVISRLLAGPTLWYSHNAALTHDMASALAANRHRLLLLTHPGEMLDANTRAAWNLRPDARFVELSTRCATAMDAAPQQWTDAILEFFASSPSA